jgi:hypothetical protein
MPRQGAHIFLVLANGECLFECLCLATPINFVSDFATILFEIGNVTIETKKGIKTTLGYMQRLS